MTLRRHASTIVAVRLHVGGTRQTNCLVQSEISLHLLARLLCNLMRKFAVPRGWHLINFMTITLATSLAQIFPLTNRAVHCEISQKLTARHSKAAAQKMNGNASLTDIKIYYTRRTWEHECVYTVHRYLFKKLVDPLKPTVSRVLRIKQWMKQIEYPMAVK